MILSFAAARADDDLEALAAAHSEAAERLAVIAKSAHDARLYLARNETYEFLLTFDPDHKKGRRWLKYKHRDGRWVRDPYKPPKDRGSASALTEHERHLAAFHVWLRNRLLEVCTKADEDRDATLASAVLQELIARYPDDSEVRARAGFVPVGQGGVRRWVLPETREGLANRARFLEAARKAARAVKPPKPGQLEAADRGTPDPWTWVLQGDSVRVIGAVGEKELLRHYQIAASAPAVFSAVFGVEAAYPLLTGRYGFGFPLYVASSRQAGNAWLAGEPGMTQRRMQFLRRMALSYFFERMGTLVKVDLPVGRLEASCHGCQAWFGVEHLAFCQGTRGAWLQEATSLYLSWLQVRTRLLHTAEDVEGRYANQQPGVPSWKQRMGDQAQDWHALAAKAIRSVSDAEVHLTAGKGMNDLDDLDLLVGYGIAVYVLEVHPDRSAAFCRDVATQEHVDLDQVLRKHVGKDWKALRPHLLRWLDEMAANAPPPGTPN